MLALRPASGESERESRVKDGFGLYVGVIATTIIEAACLANEYDRTIEFIEYRGGAYHVLLAKAQVQADPALAALMEQLSNAEEDEDSR